MSDNAGRMTLWGVEIFAAVVEEGSIAAAARRLGISPSAVSQQISGLEGALGTLLIDRSARPIGVTRAGKLFQRRAETILAEAADARIELSRHDLSRMPSLRLGMIEDFDADVTPRLLSEMAAELRDCHFILETGASHRLYDLLEARALDVVVTAEMGPPATWVEVWPLLSEPFIVAAPPGMVRAGEDVLGQLLAQPMIRYTSRHVMGRQIEAHLQRHQIDLPRRFELDSYHAVMAMVAGGAGWTIITPLGFMRAQRFRDAVEVMALPIAPLERRISLTARRRVLDSMPEDIARRMRALLDGLVVEPCVARMPWLAGSLRVL